MAQASISEFRQRLVEILTNGLSETGIRARVVIEPIDGTKLSRVIVITRQRSQLRPADWNSLLWRIISEEFGRTATYRISTIYTLTPAEAKNYLQDPGHGVVATLTRPKEPHRAIPKSSTPTMKSR